MRNQFFSPNRFLKQVPLRSQMVLKGDAPAEYTALNDTYWRDPFKIVPHDPFGMVMVMRNASIYLPISRNPDTPIARTLPYAPPKYCLLPDLRTAFD
jgi:hypothetical protein